MARRKGAERIVVALVLALGLGITWATACAIGGSVYSAFWPSPPRSYENVVVAIDGTPLIQTRHGNNYYDTTLRTLDGQAIELESENWLGQASLSKPYRAPRFIQWPITWSERIAGCSDYRKPPGAWVLVRDDRRPGHAFFVGYDTVSRAKIGYIGRKGFRNALPPSDEWFDLGDAMLNWGSQVVASSNYVTFGSSRANFYVGATAGKDRLGPWVIFLKDGDTIQEVDLRDHRVRPVGEFETLLGVSVCAQPVAMPDENEPEGNKLDEIEPSDEEPVDQIQSEPKTAHRLLARCSDRIIEINPFDGTEQEYPLPEWLREVQLTAYSIGQDQLLLQVKQGWWESGNVVDLVWLSTSGEVDRKETVKLAGHVPGDPRQASLGIAAVAPSLLPWLAGTFGVGPWAQMNMHQFPTWTAAVQEAIGYAWPGLMVVALLSIVLAAIVYQWHSRYHRPNRVAWTVMVLLTTLPGFLAYWIMHCRPPICGCEACGEQVPSNRDACAACGESLAEPRVRDTSILVPPGAHLS